jgi:transposase
MIQITPQMRILLAIEPVDFRKGIDGLCRTCREVMDADPFSGYLFVFLNKRKTSIKALTYDGQGFCLFQKRLSQGRFRWWPQRTNGGVGQLVVHELLIWNGNPSASQVSPMWRKIEEKQGAKIF